MRLPIGLTALLLLAGCGHAAAIEARVADIRQVLEQAEAQGAYVCAPRELALARAHLAFAEVEVAQGDLERATEHVERAEPTSKAALRLSPADRCGDDGPAPVATAQDRDGDAIPDAEDRCPEEPEDIDGFEDGDGCPDAQDQDGDAIGDDADLCPIEPEDVDGVLDEDGCPDPDNDLDGVPDAEDRCPEEPEDREGFQDEDGCPDPDNDGDGLADAQDRCPNEPGPDAPDGCPILYPGLEVTPDAIVLREPIRFRGTTARILRSSYPLLDTVVQVLRDNPEITLEIQGHTDARGPDRLNLRLSEVRARAVRNYLLRRGRIDRRRLTARGYGETRPRDTNLTRAGREANRRIELVRTDGAGAGG
ncbi:MAG: OmpA family protein [Sandaracinaceae bacterium]